MTKLGITCVLVLLAGMVHAIDIDFESYTAGVAPPSPWTSDPGVTVTDAIAKTGSKSLAISWTSYDSAKYPFSVAPNESASFSVWVRPGTAEQGFYLGGVSVLPSNTSRPRTLYFGRGVAGGSTVQSIEWREFGARMHSAGDFTSESWYQVNCEISLSNITLSATTESGPLSYSFDRMGEDISAIELLYSNGQENGIDSLTAHYDDLSITLPPPPATTNTLTVVSEHGSPEPPVGANEMLYGTTGTCTVEQVTFGTTNYSPIGWTMSGNEPFSGTTNWFVGTLTNDAVLTWNWETNYWLEIAFDGNGSVNLDRGFQAKDSQQILTATPDAGWLFMGWDGDLAETNQAVITMDAPKGVTAVFSLDADDDGLTNAEEGAAGSNPWKSDTDNDGFGDKLEVDNGGNPAVSDKWRVDHIRAHGGDFDLYSSNSVLNVAVGEMLFETEGNQATLSLQLEESDDLATWTNAGPAKVWTWTVDGEKKFFRVRSGQ